MASRGGPRGHGFAILVACVAAGLVGQFLVFIGLYNLGALIPHLYAYDRTPVALALGAGVGLILGGILFLSAYRSARAAGMLASLVLIPLGLSMVVTACTYGVPSTPAGTGPGPLCEPGLSLAGIVSSALGAAFLATRFVRLRWARPA